MPGDSLIIARPMMQSQTGDMNLPVGTVPYDSRPSDTPTVFPEYMEVLKLDRKSFEYEQYGDMRANLALLYVGGWELRIKAANFLWQRHKEPQDVYQSRVNRFNYFNILEPAIGWYTSYLFRREPEVDIIDKLNRRPLVDTTVTQIKQVGTGDLRLGETPDAKPSPDRTPVGRDIGSPGNTEEPPVINTANDEAGKFYTEFRGNVDRAHTTLTGFFSRLISQLLLNGRVFVLTDLEPLSGPVGNRQQAEALGSNRPYLLLYNAADVVNYRTDREGNLVWAVIKSGRVDQENPFDEPRVVDQWWIYNQTSWALYEHMLPVSPGSGASQPTSSPMDYAGAGTRGPSKNANLVNSGLHALHHKGRCPLRMFEAPEGLWLGRRAYLPVLSYLNEDNALQWLLAMTNLAVPVITGGGSEPSDSTDETGGIKYYSEIFAINLPQGAKFEWSAPSATSADVSMARCERLVEETYRILYLQDQGRPSSSPSGNRSGAAIAMEKMPSREVAESLGRYIRDAMTKVYHDIIDVRREGDAVSVSIRGFSFLENYVGLDLSDMDRLKTLGVPSGTLLRYGFKSIARLIMQDAPAHLVDLAIAEIDQWLTDKTVLEFAQSTLQPITPQTEAGVLKPPPVPARVQLAEAQG